MGNIVLLDDLTINKIAAGEVIERPASVVKELVENSIDAGANKITIDIKNGGISYIRITDNGKGFMPDDMEIAFERHATSKIRQAQDLETVTSMGFRGEALASIAAISDVELISRTEDNEIGKKIEVKGGQVLNFEDAGCPKGSTITVTDLFFNTPVRYKFLKKDFTEAGYIEDAVTRIALVHPEISIKLVNSGKTIIQTSGNGDMKSVIYSIYGKDVAENIIDVDYEYEDIKVKGVIGKPVVARSNRSNQLFFVNKRYIKDKTLTSAAEQGYKGLLTIGKYGFLVLNLEMNPQKVDVNVHPAKLEVRFEEENKVFKAIYHAIKDSLLKEDLVPDKTKIELDKQLNSSWKISPTQFGAATMQTQASNGISQAGNTLETMKTQTSSGDALTSTAQAPSEELTAAQKLEAMQNTLKGINASLSGENKPENVATGESDVAAESSEPKIDILEEINKLKNAPLQDLSILDGTENSAENKSDRLDDLFGGEDDGANVTNEHKGEGLSGKFSGLLSRFGNKKQEPEEEIKPDDTQNFIAQIYNNKNGITENTDDNGETKVVDLSEINEKMHEMDNLKMEPDYGDFNEMYAKTFGKVIKDEEKVEEEKDEYKIDTQDLKTAENVSIFDKLPEGNTPEYKYIGIAFSTYIIIEMNKELYIIDQHAAHERIMYEKIKANYYSDNGSKDSQLMLLPDIINLSHKDMQIAKDNMDIFKKAGFDLEEFGENTIKLSGVPTICLDLDTKELFLETLDEINTVARTAKQEIEDKFIATVACKAAVKANMALSREEVDNLMRQLLVLPNPFTCPHGRPTAIRMTREDIERKFSRR